MIDELRKLEQFWKEQDLLSFKPANHSELVNFENRHSISIPLDLQKYQRISFSKKHLSLGSQTSFLLDKDVEDRYHSVGASEFVKYYVVEVNGKKILNTAKYENRSLLTILYYLFLNNHELTFDDYIGRYYVKEM